MPAGRPSKLTPELTKELCELLAEGKPIKPSCAKVGIDERTFHYWRANAQRGNVAYQEFFQSVVRARAEGELRLWDIAIAGGDDARNAQWGLERAFGTNYVAQIKVTTEAITGRVLDGIDHVCSPKDCGCHEELLAWISAIQDGDGALGAAPSTEAYQAISGQSRALYPGGEPEAE